MEQKQRNSVEVPCGLMREIVAYAEQDYPRESCGFIVGPASSGFLLSRVICCRNAQDVFHKKDPENFTRTSREAYFIDPAELFRIHKELREEAEAIRIIYHSHIDGNAAFSKEDIRLAAPDGEPLFPGVGYLIIPVNRKKGDKAKLFFWKDDQKGFVECSLNY